MTMNTTFLQIKKLSKIDQIKVLEIALNKIESEGIDNLSIDYLKKYQELKNYYELQAKKLGYI